MTPIVQAIEAIPPELDPFKRAMLEAMVFAYVASWDEELVTVLAVEEEFQIPFVHPSGEVDPDWILGGKVDLRAIWRGRRVIFDHKSSSEDIRPGSTFRGRFTLNAQASQYLLASEVLEWGTEAFVFDAVKKPNRKVSANDTPESFRERCMAAIAEKPDEHLARVEVTRSAEELLEYRRDLLVDSTLIDTVRVHGLISRNESACFNYGKPCDFHPVCTRTGSLSDVSRYEHASAHEEVETPVPAGKRLLTNSARATFNTCRRKYEIRYEQGFRPLARAESLTFGIALHAALNAYWRARMENVGVREQERKDQAAWQP